MLWPKKNSYKESGNKKNSCGSKIPLPPHHNFSNGPFLTCYLLLQCNVMAGHLSKLY